MTGAAEVPRHGRPAALAVAALALYSATWRLDGPGWKIDEDAYARAGWSLVHDGVDTSPGHPPLGKLLYGGAQALFGRDLASVRSVAAVGFLLSAAVLFAFGRRLGGWWTGVAAAGLYAVLPRTMVVGGWTVADLRIERYGLLESVAAPLAVAALWFGWRWIVGDGARWAVAAGALACRRRPAVAYLVVALGTLLGAAMASPVALPHYRALWIPPLLLLVALGLVDAIARATDATTRARPTDADARADANAGADADADADADARAGADADADADGRADVGEVALAVRVGRGVAVAALVVLGLVGARAVVDQATAPAGDEREVARRAAADGVRPTKVLTYGEPVAPYFADAYDSLAPFDDGSVPAQLVVIDPSLSDAIDAASVERFRDWARAWGLTPHRVGRLEAWWAVP